jgi:hypothetical protein
MELFCSDGATLATSTDWLSAFPRGSEKAMAGTNSRADLVVLYCDLGRLQEGLAALEYAIAHPITAVWWPPTVLRTDGRPPTWLVRAGRAKEASLTIGNPSRRRVLNGLRDPRQFAPHLAG